MAKNLPTAIQRQADAAAAIEQGLVTQTTDPAPAPVEAPPTDTNNTAPAPAPAEPAPAPTPAARDAAYWEQRFKTVTGLYEQQVPGLRAQLAEMANSMEAMKRELAETKAKPQAQPQAPTLDPKDVAAFGEDLVEMVRRQAQSMLSTMAEQVNQFAQQMDRRVSTLEQQVNGVAQKANTSIEQQYYTTLKTAVPDWEQINVDPAFLEWLQVADPVYGVPRRIALQTAHERFDAERVINVFRTFVASKPAPKKPESLASQIAPSSSAGGSPQPAAPDPKRVYTQRELNDFYLEVAKGRYRGREQEQARMERELELAAAEGRIR